MSQRKEQFAFRAEPPLAESINSYKQEQDLSQSAALRKLVREGLRADELESRLSELEQRVDNMEQNGSDGGFWDFLG